MKKMLVTLGVVAACCCLRAAEADKVVVGEGEDADREVLELLRRAKREGWSKAEFLRAASALRGVYVPSLYEHIYGEDGCLAEIRPLEGAPKTVTKRIVADFSNAYFPTKQIVPSTEIVHDRSNL